MIRENIKELFGNPLVAGSGKLILWVLWVIL